MVWVGAWVEGVLLLSASVLGSLSSRIGFDCAEYYRQSGPRGVVVAGFGVCDQQHDKCRLAVQKCAATHTRWVQLG